MSLRNKAKLCKEYPYLPIVARLLSQTEKQRLSWKVERVSILSSDGTTTTSSSEYTAHFPLFKAVLSHSRGLRIAGRRIKAEHLGEGGEGLLERLSSTVMYGNTHTNEASRCKLYLRNMRKGTKEESAPIDINDEVSF